MTSAEYVPIRDASVRTGIPERTLRRWAGKGMISTLPGEHGQLVQVAEVQEAARHSSRPHRRPRSATADTAIEDDRGGHLSLMPQLDAEEVAEQLSGHSTEAGQWLASIESRYMIQLATLEQSHHAELERLEALYREQLHEREQRLFDRDQIHAAAIADKEALIDELRRRAEQAERE